MRFNYHIILAIFMFSCGGETARIKQYPDNPEATWLRFSEQYQAIKTLAFDGEFTINGEKKFECDLVFLYAAPDSFAFHAEGTLNIDLVRGAVFGDSGYWEAPRRDIFQKIAISDEFYLDDYEIAIVFENLIDALYYFRNLDDYVIPKRGRGLIEYIAGDGSIVSKLFIHSYTATPTSKLITNHADTLAQIRYFDWQKKDNIYFPGIIQLNQDDAEIIYRIKKIRINKDLHLARFIPSA